MILVEVTSFGGVFFQIYNRPPFGTHTHTHKVAGLEFMEECMPMSKEPFDQSCLRNGHQIQFYEKRIVCFLGDKSVEGVFFIFFIYGF